MNNDERESKDVRREAEARLNEVEWDTEHVLAEVSDAKALLHELQVHQIELEMQNEELIKAQAVARDALARYTDIYDFAPIGYVTLDPAGRFIETNIAAARLLGRNRAELVGKHFQYYLVRESIPVFTECLANMLASDHKIACEVQLRVHTEAGLHLRMQGTVFDQPDGTKECRMALVDITELKQAEEKLRAVNDALETRVMERTVELAEAREESEHRAAQLQSFLTSMADGVMMVDITGDVLFVNDAAIDILHAPADESFEDWLGRFKRYTLEGDRLPPGQGATARALEGEVVKEHREKMVTPWGADLVLSSSSSPVFDAEGAVIGAVTVFRDIWDRVLFERERQELLEREHHIAEVLQQAVVPPQREYQFDCCRIAVNYQPAMGEAEIGGDFYDVFELDSGKLGLVVGDITGKGLTAAIRVAAARHSIRSYAYLDSSPANVMTLVNNALCREEDDMMSMLTVFFGVFDPSTSTMVYTSAGHEPPFVRNREGRVNQPDGVGRALGVMCDYTYSESSIRLQPGDALTVVTDGITEAMDSRREFFGREGVIEYLQSAPQAPPVDIAAGLLQCAKSHAQGKLRDDAAILALEITE